MIKRRLIIEGDSGADDKRLHLLTRAYLRWFATPFQVDDSAPTTTQDANQSASSLQPNPPDSKPTPTQSKASTGSAQPPTKAAKSDDQSASSVSSHESAVCQRENLVAVVEQFRMHMRRNALIFRMNMREQRNYHTLIDEIGNLFIFLLNLINPSAKCGHNANNLFGNRSTNCRNEEVNRETQR